MPPPLRSPKVAVAALLICIVALGSVAVYQQAQLSALSKRVSEQSSELAHPSTSLSLSNFTVTKANATASPLMFVVLWNNGTAPAYSGQWLVMVYGQNNSIQSCYNGTGSLFPLFSNVSASAAAPLKCGVIGDKVVLSLEVEFVTNGRSVGKVYTEKTTIGQSQVVPVPTVTIEQLGVRTLVVPQVYGSGVSYLWRLSLTNEGGGPITAVHAALSSKNVTLAEETGCVMLSPFGGISSQTPLTSGASCNEDTSLMAGAGPFTSGQLLDVTVRVTYLNGTSSSVSTTAVVEPLYGG